MNYSKLKNAINAKGHTIFELSKQLNISRQAIYSTFSRESMSLSQFEQICQIIGANPCEFFEEYVQAPSSELKLLVDTMDKQIKLQSDIISLLREQLEDCKARIVKPALVK